MSQPTGAVEPRTTSQPVQGSVITPTGSIAAASVTAHDFFNVLRQVVTASPAFTSEADLLKAVTALTSHEKQTVAQSDQRQVLRETDLAPVEDVSKRVAANNGLPAPVATGPAIDYGKLAQAIVAAQQEQANPQVHEITDVPAATSTEAASTETSPSTGFQPQS
jgi:hypothetical protein